MVSMCIYIFLISVMCSVAPKWTLENGQNWRGCGRGREGGFQRYEDNHIVNRKLDQWLLIKL